MKRSTSFLLAFFFALMPSIGFSTAPQDPISALDGSTWLMDGQVTHYRWRVPEVEMEVEMFIGESSYLRGSLKRDSSGKIRVVVGPIDQRQRFAITIPQPDTLLWQPDREPSEGAVRQRHQYDGATVIVTAEQFIEGQWYAAPGQALGRRLSGAEAAAMDLKLQAARRTQDEQEAVANRWGVLGRLAGAWRHSDGVWFVTPTPEHLHLVSRSPTGEPVRSLWFGTNNEGELHFNEGSAWHKVTTLADGALFAKMGGMFSSEGVAFVVSDDDTFEYLTGKVQENRFVRDPVQSPPYGSLNRLGIEEYSAAVKATNDYEASPAGRLAAQKREQEALLAAEQAQQRRAEVKAENDRRMGFLRMIAGATVGAAAAAYIGADGSAAAEIIAKGAAAADPGNPLGQALVTTTTAAASSSAAGASASTAAAASGPAKAAGSYPQRPLAAGLSGACPGFTESNYTTHAFQGGGDQQLFSLCGAAYNYYQMYKNAIKQGYPEVDANRTYDAHAQAAQVAIRFARDYAAK